MTIRIVCSGTFDVLHTGHVEYLKKAKALARDSVLIVIVARDDNSFEIKKKRPKNNENVRLERIKALDFVDEAVLGFELDKIIDRVISLKPDIIALGYDQWAGEDWLREELRKRGVEVRIVRMGEFERNLHETI